VRRADISLTKTRPAAITACHLSRTVRETARQRTTRHPCDSRNTRPRRQGVPRVDVAARAEPRRVPDLELLGFRRPPVGLRPEVVAAEHPGQEAAAGRPPDVGPRPLAHQLGAHRGRGRARPLLLACGRRRGGHHGHVRRAPQGRGEPDSGVVRRRPSTGSHWSTTTRRAPPSPRTTRAAHKDGSPTHAWHTFRPSTLTQESAGRRWCSLPELSSCSPVHSRSSSSAARAAAPGRCLAQSWQCRRVAAATQNSSGSVADEDFPGTRGHS
jgi:hypothetical protein